MNNEPAVMAIGKWLSKNTRKVENIFNIRPASEVKEHRMDPPTKPTIKFDLVKGLRCEVSRKSSDVLENRMELILTNAPIIKMKVEIKDVEKI